MMLANIEVVVHGPVATHNMPCAVCRDRKAVLNMNTGIFRPCWECQQDGWSILRKPWWIPMWVWDRLTTRRMGRS